MKEPENWYLTDEIYHDIYRPEFTIQPDGNEDHEQPLFGEFFVKLFSGQNVYRMIYTCNYYGTPIFKLRTYLIDGARWQVPFPKQEILELNGHRYLYFYEQSDFMIQYEFFNYNRPDAVSYYQTFTKYVPCFKNEKERLHFQQWINQNRNEFDLEYKNVEKSLKILFDNEQFRNEAVLGETLVNLLRKYRQNAMSGKENQ